MDGYAISGLSMLNTLRKMCLDVVEEVAYNVLFFNIFSKYIIQVEISANEWRTGNFTSVTHIFKEFPKARRFKAPFKQIKYLFV